MPHSDHLKKCLLKRVEEQEIVAQQFGFCWEHIDQLLEQIRSECHEVKEAFEKNDRVHLQEELGDLLHAAAALAVFCHLDPHETLLKGITKFQKRFDAVVKLALADGHQTLHNQSFEVLMHYWDLAKKT